MDDEIEATQDPTGAEPESPAGEPEIPEAAEPTNDSAGVTAPEPPAAEAPGPVPYDRFKEVNESAKRYKQALEDAGYEIDNLTGQPVRKEVMPEVAGVHSQGTEGTPPHPKVWTTDNWLEYAGELGYDAESMSKNDWATVQNYAVSEYGQMVNSLQQSRTAETRAASELRTTLSEIDNDEQLRLSKGAREYIRRASASLSEDFRQNPRRDWLRQNGFSGPADYINKMLPRIKADAIAQNLSEIVTTAAAKGADVGVMRTKQLGGVSPAPVTHTEAPEPELRPDQAKAAVAFKMTAKEYIDSLTED